MSFSPLDRLPVIEWASWWDETLNAWYRQGLPASLTDHKAVRDYFGLDPYRQYWVSPQKPSCPEPPGHGLGLVRSLEEYRALKPHLYPDPACPPETLRRWQIQHEKGELVIWFTLEGYFWFPRELLGIERHFLAFYEQPELIHAINRDLLDFHLRVVEEISTVCSPDFMTFAEDMSYNNGPMISRACFEEFLAPCYHRIIPVLNEKNILPFMDSDGDITDIIPWLESAGLRGILPLERMAGVDVLRIRQNHPRLLLIGGLDKTVLNRGLEAVEEELERLLPAMKQGGYIPSVDHQTPPGVSVDQYRDYVTMLRAACVRAGSHIMGKMS
jgi:hypothetical protein